MSKFKAIVVDDNKSVRDVTVEFLKRTGIEAHSYETAEELLAYLFPTAVMEIEFMPDLLVIDLQLKEGFIQGIELIKKLVSPKINVPSSIMAISGVVPSADFMDEIYTFGTAVLLPKPFSLNDFCSRALRLACIGKKRRLRHIEYLQNRLESKDQKRKERPVFISYASEEQSLANGIRIHIESLDIDVWYGPTTIDIGSCWTSEIDSGVDNANVFIPIFSDNYLASTICLKELNRFLERMESDMCQELLILPILERLSDRNRNHKVFKAIAEKYQYAEFYPRITDGLTSLTMPLQAHIAKYRKHQRRIGEFDVSEKVIRI